MCNFPAIFFLQSVDFVRGMRWQTLMYFEVKNRITSKSGASFHNLLRRKLFYSSSSYLSKDAIAPCHGAVRELEREEEAQIYYSRFCEISCGTKDNENLLIQNVRIKRNMTILHALCVCEWCVLLRADRAFVKY